MNASEFDLISKFVINITVIFMIQNINHTDKLSIIITYFTK